MWGYCNILRHSGEKNKRMQCFWYNDIFNSIIHTSGLREPFIRGGKYTWTNSQKHPTLKKLDRILMPSDWADLFSFGDWTKIGQRRL